MAACFKRFWGEGSMVLMEQCGGAWLVAFECEWGLPGHVQLNT